MGKILDRVYLQDKDTGDYPTFLIAEERDIPQMYPEFESGPDTYFEVFVVNLKAETVRKVQKPQLKTIYASLTSRYERITVWFWLKRMGGN
jgi:hypothetical protein